MSDYGFCSYKVVVSSYSIIEAFEIKLTACWLLQSLHVLLLKMVTTSDSLHDNGIRCSSQVSRNKDVGDFIKASPPIMKTTEGVRLDWLILSSPAVEC